MSTPTVNVIVYLSNYNITASSVKFDCTILLQTTTDQIRCLELAEMSTAPLTYNQRYVCRSKLHNTSTSCHCVFLYSYGECSLYTSNTTVCDYMLNSGIDYVYASFKLGSQTTISHLLNEAVKKVEQLIDNRDEDQCIKQVFRVLCHFYLPPCGNSTHPVPLSSICQEECQIVQEMCKITWKAFDLALRDKSIDCSDTSRLLFPVSHCCSDAGLDLPHTSTSTVTYSPVTSTSTVAYSPVKSSLPTESDDTVVGVVTSVVILILLTVVIAVIIVPLLVVGFSKRRRRKQMESMQLDILAM